MPFEGFSINESINNIGGGAFRVKDGTYLLQLQSIEPTPEDFAGKTHIRFNFKIAKGLDGIGRTFTERWYNGEKAHFKGGQVLAAIGIDQSKLVGTNFNSSDYRKFAAFVAKMSEQLKGRSCGAEFMEKEQVTDRGTTTRSEVYEYFRANEYEGRAGSAVTAPKAATTSSAVPSAPAPTPSDTNEAELADLFKDAGLG